MTIYSVPIVKAKGKTIDVDTDEAKLPEAVYKYALALGLKALVNRGTSTLKRDDFADDAAFIEEATKIAHKQVEEMYAGKTRIIGMKSGKAKQGAEMTEALRLAKIYTKAQMKEAGIKVSLVSAADITKAAKAYLESDPEPFLSAARENLAKSTKFAGLGKGVDLKALLPIDEKKAKAVASKKAKGKSEISAAQAGKIVPQKKKGAPHSLTLNHSYPN